MKITGTITGAGADADLIAAVTPASPRISSLGSVVTDALSSLGALATLIAVSLVEGKVRVNPTVNVWSDAIGGLVSPVGTTRSLDGFGEQAIQAPGFGVPTTSDYTPGEVSAPTGTDHVAELMGAAFAPRHVSMSLGAAVDAVDRAFQASAYGQQLFDNGGGEFVILIDQANETVSFVECSAVSWTNEGTIFTRTQETADSGQWGE